MPFSLKRLSTQMICRSMGPMGSGIWIRKYDIFYQCSKINLMDFLKSIPVSRCITINSRDGDDDDDDEDEDEDEDDSMMMMMMMW